MTTRHVLLDVERCLRAATAPLLTLGALTLARTPRLQVPKSTSIDHLVLLAWRPAIAATLFWLLLAVIWAVTRPRRDRRAFQRLQRLREIATPTDRPLVHVQTTGWSSTAGQHVVVVNVATGATSRVWLPETTVPVGAFVVLERTDSGVSVVDWMNAPLVEAGHRHEQRQVAHRPNSDQAGDDLLEQGDREDALQLIDETEQFLKEQEPRR